MVIAYRIQTPRLVLRCWNPQDAPLLKEAIDRNLEHLRAWMDWAWNEPVPLADKVQRLRAYRAMFDQDEDYAYGIFNSSETQVLGGTGLHTRLGKNVREIGYWIDKEHGNQGLATEATSALVRVAFEISQVQRIEIHCEPLNVRSASIPKKLGFTNDGILRGRGTDPDGGERDTQYWSLFSTEYSASPAKLIEIEVFDVLGQRII